RSTMFGVGTFIINFSGPASPQRHDPTRAVDHALTCTPFPEEPSIAADECPDLNSLIALPHR
ncbi:hypothetical protein WHI96_26775, partial [Pseudonocardia tropica]